MILLKDSLWALSARLAVWRVSRGTTTMVQLVVTAGNMDKRPGLACQ
ncbi:hypothetical protein [Paenibacillus jiagnxiensis]